MSEIDSAMCFDLAREDHLFFQTARDAVEQIRHLLEQCIAVIAINFVLTPTAGLEGFHPLRVLYDRALHALEFKYLVRHVRTEVIAVIEVCTPLFIPFRDGPQDLMRPRAEQEDRYFFGWGTSSCEQIYLDPDRLDLPRNYSSSRIRLYPEVPQLEKISKACSYPYWWFPLGNGLPTGFKATNDPAVSSDGRARERALRQSRARSYRVRDPRPGVYGPTMPDPAKLGRDSALSNSPPPLPSLGD